MDEIEAALSRIQVGAQAELEKRQRDSNSPEVRFADLAPALLIYDLDKANYDEQLIPQSIIDSVGRRRFSAFVPTTQQVVAKSTLISPIEKRRFIQQGYVILVAPLRRSGSHARGRRNLTHAEQAIRNALSLWTYALIPEITAQFGARNSRLRTDRLFAWLTSRAPSLALLAESSHAGRINGGGTTDQRDTENYPDLRSFIEALEDHGRKIATRLPGEVLSCSGEALRMKMRQITENHVPSQEVLPELTALRTDVLEVLAKARRIAAAIAADDGKLARGNDKAMNSLGELRAHQVVRSPEQYGKRAAGSARKIVQGQFHSRLVQSGNIPSVDRLTVADLAGIAFLCDIDPYLICAQHMLFSDEIDTVRAFGRLKRGELADASEYKKLIMGLADISQRAEEGRAARMDDLEQIAIVLTEIPKMLELEGVERSNLFS
ncbi:hypothetical protein [Paracoccus sp. 22332]|uniref:hypothetical protein n=1 Tax=Paracoccus sp. 22332 TaxID=3453913 RepID=UPI003F87C834